ncbi:metal-binding protein [Serratia fonticola]|uniref:metal-binding protein n=1 Tax=Serratia fonticola TaxID=47917 RepID=UPI0013790A76|nr:metal-binding protein [Serratia fonticola]NCG52451.1 metal-binding protein [Serratia fonticola]
MTKISERIKYTRINDGYCQICGCFGPLSKDHVPPKCVILPGLVEQRLITEVMGRKNIKGVKANNGSVFKTICSVCNSNLSVFDSEIKRVTNRLSSKIVDFVRRPSSVYSFISEGVNVDSYLKGMVGHMLAAVPNIACKESNSNAPFYEPLRQFVLGNNDNVEDTHSFYYWFYPHRMSVAGSCFSIFDITLPREVGMGMAGCLYFYPVALLITDKGKKFSEIMGFANELKLKDKNIYLNLSARNYNNTIFPFFSLRSSMVAMHGAFITVSSSSSRG